MTRALSVAWLFAAGCFPTDAFDFGLDPRTQTVVYLVVQNCIDQSAEDPYCGPAAGDAYLAITADDEVAAFNLGAKDRLFVGQYAQPAEVLGLPAAVQLESSACPARPFPPPLAVTGFDLEERAFPLDAMPADRALPEFTYQSCFESGCLALEDGVPICSTECSSDESPSIANGASASVSNLDIPAWNLPPTCPTWFDFAARTCRDALDLCDADGWPTAPASGVFVDPTAPPGGDGLTRATPFNRADQIADEPVILLRASPLPLTLPEISWTTEVYGCWQPGVGRSRINATLTRTELSSSAAISGVRFDNGVRVTARDVELAGVEIGGQGVEVESGASLALVDSIVTDTTTVAIRSRGTLRTERVYVSGALSHAVECASGEADLEGLFVKTVIGSGVIARSGCALDLSESSLDSVGGDGVAILAATATLSGVRVTVYGTGPESGRAGLRVSGGRAVARTVRIGQSRRTDVDRPAVLAEDAVLEVDGAVIVEVLSGVVAVSSELDLKRVSFETVTRAAIELRRDTTAQIAGVSIVEAGIGIAVDEAALVGREITIAGGELDEASGLVLGPGAGATAMLADLVMRALDPGVRVADQTTVELTTVLLEDAAVAVEGGRLVVDDAVIRPGDDSAGFVFEGLAATTAEVHRTVVEGGVGVAVNGDADERLVELGGGLDVSEFRPFFAGVEYAVAVEQCRYAELPHRLIAGIGVRPAAPVRWP